MRRRFTVYSVPPSHGIELDELDVKVGRKSWMFKVCCLTPYGQLKD